MALWKALFGVGPGDIEEAFGERDLAGEEMRAALARWQAMYYDGSVTRERDASSRLPYAIVHKLVQTVFSEYGAYYKEGAGKAGLLGGTLESLDGIKAEAMQQAMISGECMLKPCLDGEGVRYQVVPRGNYCVFGRDTAGAATCVGLAEAVEEGRERYTLLEKRRVDEAGFLHIENRLYHSRDGRGVGGRVALGRHPRFAHLPERATVPLPVNGVGLVALRMPMANCVDLSREGVSVYEAASGLIERVYELEAAFRREFRNAASRVIASSDVLAVGKDGQRRLEDDLFIALEDDPAVVGVNVYSPPIREESFLNRKNDLLRAIESVLGLKRGMLSEANASERTATEITSSMGEYNLTIVGLQKAWRSAVLGAVHLADVLGQAYLGWDGEEAGEPVVDFGDGALFDRGRVWEEYQTMVKEGWLAPEIALAWYFDVPLEEPGALEKVRGMMPVGGAAE